jgi:L-asparagine permease
MAIAIYVLATRHPIDGVTPGLHIISDHGGLFPQGFLVMLWILQGVVFAYAAVEMVGVAAG